MPHEHPTVKTPSVTIRASGLAARYNAVSLHRSWCTATISCQLPIIPARKVSRKATWKPAASSR